VPANIAKNDSVLLSIGNIEATAELRLNKKLLGYVWMPDFKLKVSGLLPGTKHIGDYSCQCLPKPPDVARFRFAHHIVDFTKGSQPDEIAVKVTERK